MISHHARKYSSAHTLVSVIFRCLACAAFLVLAACAQKDPLIGKWETSQAEGGGKTFDKTQLDALRMGMTIQLNEDKSFVMEMAKNTFKGSWEYAKDSKKLALKVDPAQSTEKSIPSLSFDSVEVSAGKSLKMSIVLGQSPVVYTYLPAK